MVPPFVWIRGRLFVVANWTEGIREGDWLLLRPATAEENDNYLHRVGDAEEEAFYTSVLWDEDRLTGRQGWLQRG
jgi:hypothetical protein